MVFGSDSLRDDPRLSALQRAKRFIDPREHPEEQGAGLQGSDDSARSEGADRLLPGGGRRQANELVTTILMAKAFEPIDRMGRQGPKDDLLLLFLMIPLFARSLLNLILVSLNNLN